LLLLPLLLRKAPEALLMRLPHWCLLLPALPLLLLRFRA
jgi:hypothetical protein